MSSSERQPLSVVSFKLLLCVATTLFCDHQRRLSTRNMEENPKISERRCIPCEGGITPLHAERIEQLKKQLHPDWKIHQDPFMKLSRTFVMKNFTAALAFINKVGELAEDMGHHPGFFS
jgi:hypothetical protein